MDTDWSRVLTKLAACWRMNEKAVHYGRKSPSFYWSTWVMEKVRTKTESTGTSSHISSHFCFFFTLWLEKFIKLCWERIGLFPQCTENNNEGTQYRRSIRCWAHWEQINGATTSWEHLQLWRRPLPMDSLSFLNFSNVSFVEFFLPSNIKELFLLVLL